MSVNLILHLHPRKVRAHTLRFTLTFGLGGMAALLFVMQVFTGLLLKFHSEPSPENAYNSILNLRESLLFGKMLRNLHHWSAIAMRWVVFLHMLRVVRIGFMNAMKCRSGFEFGVPRRRRRPRRPG